jgi:hypothetical protein
MRASKGIELGNLIADGFTKGIREGIEKMEKKTLRDKWIEARDQVKEMVSNEMETLPVIIFHSGDLESFKAFEYTAEDNPHNFTPQEIDEMVNEAFEPEDEGYHYLVEDGKAVKATPFPFDNEAPMDLEDYIHLVEFQKKEIAKLEDQKNELKKRLLENIQGIGEISKERDLWKLTAELMYDRSKDVLGLSKKDK